MDKKIIAIATVVAIVAIIGGIAYAMLKDDCKCDYTLLDSTDNVKPGFTALIEAEDNGGTIYSKKVVDSVQGDKVAYTLYVEIKNIHLSDWNTSEFRPGYVIVDYTSEDLPEGISVVKTGDRYKITGTMTDESGMKETYDLEIVYDIDEETVQYVNGTLTSDDGEMSSTDVYAMNGDEVSDVYSSKGTEKHEVNVQRFLDDISIFYPDAYKGATVEDGKFGGVDVKIYTFNGVTIVQYIDTKFYVYNGHLLKQEGKIIFDGVEYDSNLLLKVYQA